MCDTGTWSALPAASPETGPTTPQPATSVAPEQPDEASHGRAALAAADTPASAPEPASPADESKRASRTIRVTVTDAPTGTPLAGARGA